MKQTGSDMQKHGFKLISLENVIAFRNVRLKFNRKETHLETDRKLKGGDLTSPSDRVIMQ